MQEAIYEGKNFVLSAFLESQADRKLSIEQLKKRADKGAFHCPYCNEALILRSGEVREEHFSHRHSRSCEISTASEVYYKQTKRESKKHSVIKDIIYDELKTQEKIIEDLDVGYGFVKKAAEKWKYYPDIVVKNKDKELAITILTGVTHNTDAKLVNQIKSRNRYFKSKQMVPIWFVESAEQSVDMENRVIHLWEAELDLALKTPEDLIWEQALNQLPIKPSLFTLFQYFHRKSPNSYNVQSLYYVDSSDTNIVFKVQRFIRDEEEYPFRAFALNEGYQFSLSTALLATESIQLSDPEMEKKQREQFIQTVKQKKPEILEVAQRIQQNERWSSANDELVISYEHAPSPRSAPVEKEKGRLPNSTRTTYVDKSNFKYFILNYFQNRSQASASEITEYLVAMGASRERFLTGRYKIYSDVCLCLISLEEDSLLELVANDGVNDRVYKLK